MKRLDLGQTIAVLANVGVIGGLVFVGLQLQQDRDIAVVNGLRTTESNFYYWAELVSSNGDLWARGLAGESLSAGELVQFEAMAEARQFALYSRWYAAGGDVTSGAVTQESFMQELAVEIASNPGFLRWWRDFSEHLIEIGRSDEYDEALTAAIDDYLAARGTR